MPKAMERELKIQARHMGLSGDRANAFIYGSMRRQTGWVPSTQKKGRKKK
jgi:hypothetical protein